MQKAGGVTAETGGKGKDGRNMQGQLSREKMLQRQILPERRSFFRKRSRTIIGTGMLLAAIAAVGGFFAVTGGDRGCWRQAAAFLFWLLSGRR